MNDIKNFEKELEKLLDLLQSYGSSWRMMRATTLLDLMKVKLNRIEHILEHDTEDSGESIQDNLQDLSVYALWALVRLGEPANNE